MRYVEKDCRKLVPDSLALEAAGKDPGVGGDRRGWVRRSGSGFRGVDDLYGDRKVDVTHRK